MTEYEKLLNEYKSLAGDADKASEHRKAEIITWLKNHRSTENDALANRKLDEWLDEMESSINYMKLRCKK